EDLAPGQEAQGNALAVDGGDGGNADVDFLAFDADVDAAILRQPFLGNVHSRHDLDAGDEGGLVTFELRRHGRLVQDAVDAITDAQLVLGGLEMDVRGSVLVGLPDDLVDELD